MSHQPERKEKDCLNCNAKVYNRYCHVCGQENVEPRETFWHLVTHFVYDITHFDGKFFSTVKYLLLKPAYLSYEYTRGRRNSYLNPIRMYVFTSAFFFIFFFSVFDTSDTLKAESTNKEVLEKRIAKEVKRIENRLTEDEVDTEAKAFLQKELQLLRNDLVALQTDTVDVKQLYFNKREVLSFTNEAYSTVEQYDSVQAALPPASRDGWLVRNVRRKGIEVQVKYDNNWRLITSKLFDKFFHMFPQILFISLPVFALILKLLYFRHKKLYYFDHAIFSIHLYVAMFILMFIQISIDSLQDNKYLGWLDYLTVPLILYTVWYIYKAMRNFYMQSRAKTILKFLILLFISQFVMTLLFVVFLIFSAYTL